MKKKTVSLQSTLVWNPANKEPWHLEFDEEPVNDDRWTCVVTAMIPAKPEDDECIQIFTESVATGLRKSIKVITMAQVIKTLKEKESNDKGNKSKAEEPSKSGKRKSQNTTQTKPQTSRTSPIVNLVSKYATFTEEGCQIPVDLTAAIIKHLILNIKEENVFRMKVDAVKEKKMRENNIRNNFIKRIKPFKATSGENFVKGKNENCKPESINDEPSFGPDLYIVLTDFYDPFCFCELNKINVPFMAFLKISNFKEIIMANSQISFANKPETSGKKENLIFSFWKVLKENCLTLEKTLDFKDFLFLQYRPQFPKTNESKQLIRDVIFDDLSWMLYSVFAIHRQHETYLRETHVQSMVVSLEPLNLSECRVYNELCDSLVTGLSGSILLILYAIVEQVANSVPFTKSVVLEHESKERNCFQNQFDSNATTLQKNFTKENSEIRNLEIVTPCSECKDKKFVPMLMREIFSEESDLKINKWKEEIKKNNENNISNEKIEETALTYQNSLIDDSSLNLFLPNETYTEVEVKNKKNLENPSVISCLYGDKLTFYNTHCDLKLIDLNSIFSRFLERTDIPQIWSKYPALSIGSRCFYNFHFQRLLEATKDTRDLLKIKIFFTLLMKYIGVTKSYLYKGEEENLSQSIRTPSREKFKKLSKVKFDQLGIVRRERDHDRNFSSYFFRLFVATSNRKKVTMKTTGAKREDKRIESIAKTESTNIRKAISALHMSLVSHRNSGFCFPYFFKAPESANASSSFNQSKAEKDLITFQSLLECYDLISLSESHTLGSGDDYANLITNFNFFEKLEPRRMVQRLLEAKEEFNTTQCSYFAPTDSLIILVHNDCDHRGIFFTSGYGTLLTPVSLRDFYNHVYLDIKEWLAAEKKQYNKFVTEMEEQAKDLKQKQNKQYLANLKLEFEAMNEEEKEKFLASHLQSEQSNCRADFEIKEDELPKDLPIKPKPQHPTKISFLATKFLDVRVETERKVHEIHSRDGTEVNVIIDSWLYEPNRLLTLSIKRSNLRFYYHQWMERNFETNFFLRTSSDIYFVFYKKYQEEIENAEAKYHVKISWPTGLMLENIFSDKTGTYIKQYYIKVYRKWRNLEKEKCRCFLKCGQILIFYENGDVQVLCASGTKHVIKELPHLTHESGTSKPDTCRVQTITTTGQVWVWERNGIDHCLKKKKLIGNSKVYIGVDSKTQETFYRREDGLRCMLWPNGKLVTSFSDGTKITSTPYFELEEVTIEWTEEEKLYFENLETKYRAEMSEIKPKSKTILKKLSPDSLLTQTNFSVENKEILKSDGFVSVSLSYLMEHPQYSTIYYDFQSLETDIKMPGQFSIKIDREENYLVNQEHNYLAVKKKTAEFYTLCPDCFEKSNVTIYFDSDNPLCKFVDLVNTEFFINRNGDITYHENFSDTRHSENGKRGPEKSRNFLCKSDHIKPMSKNQRCFVLERNLSGMEFLHSESLARYCFKLPEGTYYDLNDKYGAGSLSTHVFSSPYYSMAYENWKMSYEDENNLMPTNLKKGDLKELGTKGNCQSLFKYPFPMKETSEIEKQCKNLNGLYFNVPKIIVNRVIKCLSKNPKTVIDEVKNYVGNYQKGIHNITSVCKKHKKFDDENCFNCVKSLEKVVIPPKIYWWTSNPETSTEIDIHNSIHLTNLMQEFKDTVRNPSKNWLKCKHNFYSFSTNENTVPIYEKANSFTENI